MLQIRFALVALAIAISLFLGMLLFLEVGRRLGVRRLQKPGARAGVGVVDGTVYALLALLLGFTFSSAAARFDNRRMLVGQEANSAGTVWQRIDLLPPEQQPAIRAGLRAYLDSLIVFYTKPSGALAGMQRPYVGLTIAEHRLWTLAVAACLAPGGEQARMLLLPGLNELFGAVEQERLARSLHPPYVIFVMLGLAALAAALFVGYAIATTPARNWIYMVGVAATIASATYVIIELEFPRLGLVRVDKADQNLVELRATMD